jgi:hypothetical protein
MGTWTSEGWCSREDAPAIKNKKTSEKDWPLAGCCVYQISILKEESSLFFPKEITGIEVSHSSAYHSERPISGQGRSKLAGFALSVSAMVSPEVSKVRFTAILLTCLWSGWKARHLLAACTVDWFNPVPQMLVEHLPHSKHSAKGQGARMRKSILAHEGVQCSWEEGD